MPRDRGEVQPTVVFRTERKTKYIRTGGYALGTLIVAGLLGGITNHALGLSLSIGIPFTDAHVTFGGSIGDPASLIHALPHYIQNGHLNNIHDGLGYAQSIHVGPAGVQGFETIGKQAGAPGVDLNISWGSAKDTFTIL